MAAPNWHPPRDMLVSRVTKQISRFSASTIRQDHWGLVALEQDSPQSIANESTGQRATQRLQSSLAETQIHAPVDPIVAELRQQGVDSDRLPKELDHLGVPRVTALEMLSAFHRLS